VALTAGSGATSSSIYVNHNAPTLFTLNSAGRGRALVFESSFRLVDQPKEGEVVILYAAGLGETDPPASSDTGPPPPTTCSMKWKCSWAISKQRCNTQVWRPVWWAFTS
jgi:uncharacterized protein (TIGR03437 family)